MLRSLLLGMTVWLVSCAPGGICDETREPVAGARCVSDDDCPRSGEVGVCLQDTGNERPCVLCDAVAAGEPQTQCFLITPVSCP